MKRETIALHAGYRSDPATRAAANLPNLNVAGNI